MFANNNFQKFCCASWQFNCQPSNYEVLQNILMLMKPINFFFSDIDYYYYYYFGIERIKDLSKKINETKFGGKRIHQEDNDVHVKDTLDLSASICPFQTGT